MKHLMKLRFMRALAIVLSAVFALLTFLSAVVVTEMYNHGFYSAAKEEEMKNDLVYTFAREYGWVLIGFIDTGSIISTYYKLDDYAEQQEIYYNISVEGGGSYELSVPDGEKIAYTFEYTFYTYAPEVYYDSAATEESEEVVTHVTINIPASRSVTDEVYYADKYFHDVYSNRYNVIIVCAVSAVLTVLTYAFAVAAAGKRRGEYEAAVPTFFDKIPFDILLAAELGLAFLAVAFCDAWWGDVMTAIAVCICIFVGSITLTLLSMTAVVRMRLGTLVRNNVTVKLAVWVWRVTCRVVRAVPLFWRALVVALILPVADFVFVVWWVDGDFPIPYFMLWILIVAGICLAAYNMSRLKKGAERLAAGDLEKKIPTDNLIFDFKRHAENLNSIGDGMSAAVEERMKGERFKTELITNVSHDIKTPVTSIINYVDLLGKCELEGDAAEYVEVLRRQSEKLKKLTEDIVEASKASSGVIAVDCKQCDLVILLSQTAGEYEERFTAAGLNLVSRMPESPVPVFADGRLIFRIFDNLLGNAVKYSLPGTRVYLTLTETDGYATASVSNVSREPLPVSGEELTERFVRGDASRHTEGSGLGLSIAKSLAELQGAKLTVKTDGDYFKATLRMKTVANDVIE